MVQFELDPDEREILDDVLENDLSDLRMEIADTDSLDYRDKLRVRKQVLGKVLTALRASA